ncbi:MAG: hypothetical protein JRH05_08055 [Deltaproteobacteria bacterium]|nr:hypothetical protein [Deltaproteobacteria bacterium]
MVTEILVSDARAGAAVQRASVSAGIRKKIKVFFAMSSLLLWRWRPARAGIGMPSSGV